jgi:hypothetical protein
MRSRPTTAMLSGMLVSMSLGGWTRRTDESEVNCKRWRGERGVYCSILLHVDIEDCLEEATGGEIMDRDDHLGRSAPFLIR